MSSELVKLIGKFFARDFLYILGGSTIIFSMIYLNEKAPSKFETYQLIGILSVGYVVGYANQQFYSILRITTTAPRIKPPNKFIKKLFKRFTYDDFRDEIVEKVGRRSFFKVVSQLNEKSASELERIINLKHIGTTTGPNWMTTSFIWAYFLFKDFSYFNLSIFVFLLSTSLILIFLGWIMTLLQMDFISDSLEEIEHLTKDKLNEHTYTYTKSSETK